MSSDHDHEDPAAPASEHRQAWDLIPWVLNGTASPADAALVEAHLARCADCRVEFDFEQQLQRGLARREPLPRLDAEAALRRMNVRLPQARRSPQRWLVAAVLVQAVGLAGLATLLALRQERADYEVLSHPDTASATAIIRIAPAPGLQIGELRALLARSDLQIVQASSDASHLALALAPGARFDRAQAIALLRAEPGILLAEPIGAP